MLRRFVYSTKGKSGKEPTNFKVNIIGRIYGEGSVIKSYLLFDPLSSLTTWYPATLVQANRIEIEKNDCFLFSHAMYKFWFGNTIHEEYRRLSQIALENFNKITSSSSIIMDNSDYSNVTFSFLQSHIKGTEVSFYSIGDLLKSWLNTTKLHTKSSLYFVKVSVCFSTANFTYLAWDHTLQTLVRGRGKSESCHKLYFDLKVLDSHWKQPNYPDIYGIMNLFDTLNISY
jgi:hypothetical protein